MTGLPAQVSAITNTLDRVAAAAPGAAARAGAALSTLLRAIQNSRWPEVAWVFSRLTSDGFPAEFTFTAGDAALRYTVEVAGPELAEEQRLPQAIALLGRLGAALPSAGMTSALGEVQAGGGLLLYGAWLGGRHDSDQDRYKLYVEVPRSGTSTAARLVRELMGADPILPGRPDLLRMIGHEPATGRTELYYRVEGLSEAELAHLIGRAGLAARLPELLVLAADVAGRQASLAWAAWRMGYSFSFPAGKGPVVFSLYTFAQNVFGPDMAVRRGLLAAAAARCWDMAAYAAASEPLAVRADGPTGHGMLGFVVPPQGPLSVHIGLRPPG